MRRCIKTEHNNRPSPNTNFALWHCFSYLQKERQTLPLLLPPPKLHQNRSTNKKFVRPQIFSIFKTCVLFKQEIGRLFRE
jgi:hypothetical protein